MFYNVSLPPFALLAVEMSGCEPYQELILSLRTKGKTHFLYCGVVTAGVSHLLQRQEQLAGVGGEVRKLGVPLKSVLPDPRQPRPKRNTSITEEKAWGTEGSN